MAAMSDDWYTRQAVELFQTRRDDLARPALEVAPAAEAVPGAGPPRPGVYPEGPLPVSRGSNPGAWVMLWAWVPDPPPADPADKKDTP